MSDDEQRGHATPNTTKELAQSMSDVSEDEHPTEQRTPRQYDGCSNDMMDAVTPDMSTKTLFMMKRISDSDNKPHVDIDNDSSPIMTLKFDTMTTEDTQ